MIITAVVFAMVFVGCDNKSETFVEPDNDVKIEVEYGSNETIEDVKDDEVTKPTATEEIMEETKPKETLEEPKQEQEQEQPKKFFYLSDYERRVVECMVMGESGNQPYDGQVLVAQCILNACLKDGLQPSEVRTRYKYSGWHNNPSDSVKEAVSAVFDDGYKVTDEFILYFYAPKYCNSKWHESQRFVIEVGGHRFFAEW